MSQCSVKGLCNPHNSIQSQVDSFSREGNKSERMKLMQAVLLLNEGRKIQIWDHWLIRLLFYHVASIEVNSPLTKCLHSLKKRTKGFFSTLLWFYPHIRIIPSARKKHNHPSAWKKKKDFNNWGSKGTRLIITVITESDHFLNPA